MRKIAFVLFLMVISVNLANAELESRFTSGKENWRCEGDVTCEGKSTNGNPGGFLKGTDKSKGGIWYSTVMSKNADGDVFNVTEADTKESSVSLRSLPQR